MLIALGLVAVPSGASASTPVSAGSAAVADASSAPDAASAAAIAAAFGHPVVVDSQTTETEQVAAQPDGTMQLTESTLPVRARQNGAWVPLDLNLVPASDGMLAPRAAAVPVEFSAGGSGPLARVQSASGSWLSETWRAGALPVPSVDGDSATYADVFPGVDLRLTAGPAGMSELLVVKSPAAASDAQLSSVAFGVSGASLTSAAGTTSGGSPAVAASNGLSSASPSWWDSSGAGAGPDGPGGLGSPRPVPDTVTAGGLSVNAAAAAATPNAAFPVYVDPDWTGGTLARTFVDSAYPTQSYWNGSGASDSYQHVGYIDAADSDDGRAHTTRSYWRIDTHGIAGKHVLAAHFNTTEVYAYSCQAREVDLYATDPISSSTTWNSRPAFNTKLDSATVAHGYNSSCPAATVGFDVGSYLQGAANSSASYVTLGLKAASESDYFAWKKFSASASVTVTYNTPPNVPTGLKFASPQITCGTSTNPALINNAAQALRLQATVSDPDGGNVASTFKLTANGVSKSYSDDEGSAASGSAEHATVPQNTYPDGTTVSWTVSASDGTDTSASSAACVAKVDDTGPPPPSVALAAGQAAPTTVGQPVSVTITANPTDHVARFIYWMTPTQQVAPSPAAPVQFAAPQSLPACTSAGGGPYAVGGENLVCSDMNGAATVTVAPVDDTSTLWVASLDSAVNMSATAAGLEFDQVSADANFAAGHGWITDSLPVSPPPTSVPDSATSSPQALTVGSGTAWDNTTNPGPGNGPPTTALSLPGYAELDRYFNGTDHVAVDESAAGSGYTLEEPLGQLAQTAGSNTVQLYSCQFGADEFTSTFANCEGQKINGSLGFGWASAADVPAGQSSVALYRCRRLSNGEHFDSLQSDCEGQTVEARLAYLAGIAPSTTANPVLDTTKSFTVAAWLDPSTSDQNSARTYTALSQGGAANSGFYLQIGSGLKWRFCVRSQTSNVVTDCATAAAPPTLGVWTFVAGVWDAANQQVRIYVGAGSQPAGIASHVLPSGDVSAAEAFMVGSGVSNYAPASQWSGLIDDPTAAQVVADQSQLSKLYTQQPPA